MNVRRDHVEWLTIDYTEPEPEFLYVVATHSGYFKLRQHCSTRARRGKRCSLLTREILNNGHTSVRDYPVYGSICHLFSITLYGRIEKGNLRNHRAHSFEFISEFISTQLVVLYFILEHRDIEHLDQHDKVNFFCEKLGVSEEFLPGLVSEGDMETRPTVRYFVDASPLFLALRLPGSPPVVALSYLNSGIQTIASFLTHLAASRSLFRQLSSFRLLCISPKHPQSVRAKERFHSVVKKPLESDVSGAPPSFRDAQEVRKLPVRTASDRDLEFLNEAEPRFRGERFVCMQRAWESGELNQQDLRHEFCPIEADRAVFFGYVSGENHSYLAKRNREPVNVA